MLSERRKDLCHLYGVWYLVRNSGFNECEKTNVRYKNVVALLKNLASQAARIVYSVVIMIF